MPENQLPKNRIYRFGEYRLSADDRMLLRGKERVEASPRLISVLLVLVENAGRLVSKETLMRLVWFDSFVGEGNLNRTVSRLRKTLGETPDENRFIETIPRVGYRFVAEVELVTDDTATVPEATVSAAAGARATEGTRRKTEETRRSSKGWLVVSLVSVCLAGAAFWLWQSRRVSPPARGAKRDKNVPVRLTDSPAGDIRPYQMRDGNIRFGRWQVGQVLSFVMDAGGGNQRRETAIPGLRMGSWSPDSKKVIFYKDNDSSLTLYLANSDGTGEVRLPFMASNLDWSPDGGRILFQHGQPNSDIFLYTLATGQVETVVGGPAFDADPAFSPDGNQIAYVSNRDGNFDIYVQNLDGTRTRRLTNHPAHDQFPCFSPDGTEIAFNSNREGESFDVYVMSADGGRVFRLTDWRGDETVYPGCWSADGTRLRTVSIWWRSSLLRRGRF
jgi:DNA-binding winged helix-turn-helix (wHTH) protein